MQRQNIDDSGSDSLCNPRTGYQPAARQSLAALWVTVLAAFLMLASPLSAADDKNNAQFDVAEDAYSYVAPNIEIIWLTPNEYSDVRPSNESRRGFRERTTRQLSQFIERELSSFNQQNGTSYRLQMTVRDLDLAGQVWPASFVGLGNGINDVRIVKRLYIPRITFDFSLSDDESTYRSEMKYEVKDMNFMQGINRYFRSDTLRYEKQMIAEWLNKMLVGIQQTSV